MNSINHSYVYEPLSDQSDAAEIRLVRLLPSDDFAAPVRCAIIKVSLDDPPLYEALSYTWGELKSPKIIFVEGKEYHVTTNLELAFRYLRLKDRARIIWADALCINQQDLVEKASQVRKMRTIYLSARQVVVWLGEEAGLKPAIGLCKGVKTAATSHRKCQKSIFNFKPSPGSLKNITSSLRSRFLRPKLQSAVENRFSKNELKSCSALFRRSWWSRTWVLQEVIHSRPVWVYIGHFQVELDELIKLYRDYRKIEQVSHILRHEDVKFSELVKAKSHVQLEEIKLRLIWSSYLAGFGMAVTGIPAITTVREHFQQGRELSLLNLLRFFRSRSATDPRDKIFALFGMTSQASTLAGHQIDYMASKRRVYTDTSRLLFMKVLLYVESPDREVSSARELPSWVPDFTTQQQYITQMMSALSSHADRGLSDDVYQCANQQWSLQGQDDDRYRLRLMGIYIGIITSVIAGHVTDSPNLRNDDQVKFFKYNTDVAKRHQLLQDEPFLAPADPAHALETNWGPIWAEKGDIVVVAVGCQIPVVLRKEQDHYLLVGGCWLIDSQLPNHKISIMAQGFLR